MPPGVTRGSLIAGCRQSGGWGFEFHVLNEGGQHQLPQFALVYPLWKDARVRGMVCGFHVADWRGADCCVSLTGDLDFSREVTSMHLRNNFLKEQS